MPYVTNDQSPRNQEMNQYFSSLPAYVQESILQSGTKLNTVESMRRFVESLNKKD